MFILPRNLEGFDAKDILARVKILMKEGGDDLDYVHAELSRRGHVYTKNAVNTWINVTPNSTKGLAILADFYEVRLEWLFTGKGAKRVDIEYILKALERMPREDLLRLHSAISTQLGK